jgi:hypothetical protein
VGFLLLVTTIGEFHFGVSPIFGFFLPQEFSYSFLLSTSQVPKDMPGNPHRELNF